MASSELDQAREMFDAFVDRVTQLDELHKSSSIFCSGFQQELEKLRRPLLVESSKLVASLLKHNPTERTFKYQEAGFCHVFNEQQAVIKLNEVTTNLNKHFMQAQSLLQQLQELVAQIAVLVDKDLNPYHDKSSTTASILQIVNDNNQGSCIEEVKLASWQSSDYAIIMSAMLDMFEKDFRMQELIFAGMSLDVDSECLQTYGQMWLLRPFINDNFIKRWTRK